MPQLTIDFQSLPCGLSQLVDKALLRRDPDAGRYSIHELLRQYAEEQLKLSIVVLNHPASAQNSLNRSEFLREEAEKFRVQIATQLDQPRYLSAWEAGQRRRLADVVAQILRLDANLSAEEQTLTKVSAIPVS